MYILHEVEGLKVLQNFEKLPISGTTPKPGFQVPDPSDHYFGQSGLGVPQKNLRRCGMLPLLVSVRNDNICHGSQINNVPGTADGHGDDVRRHYGSGNRPQKGIINSSQHAV